MERARNAGPAERALRCPNCGHDRFRTLSDVGVELDICETCGGVFLDGPEVDTFLKRGRSKTSVFDSVGKALDYGADGIGDILVKLLS